MTVTPELCQCRLTIVFDMSPFNGYNYYQGRGTRRVLIVPHPAARSITFQSRAVNI